MVSADGVFMKDPLVEEALSFFEKYKSEFDQSNWISFTALLHEPFVTVRGDGSVKCCQSHAEAQSFFANVADSWRREGYDHFTTSNFDVIAMGKLSRLVTFDWEMLRADGSMLRKWRQSYQLIRQQEEWKVLGSTFHVS
jgi:hypothetical protein